jgi:putative transposase
VRRARTRVNIRNGYRHREFDTRAGTLDVVIPKLRSGSYFPDWLLKRRRAERALTTVVATCYLLGVSTRRMEKLVETLGITRLSKSQVSTMAAELDSQVASWSPPTRTTGWSPRSVRRCPVPRCRDAEPSTRRT